MGAFSNDRTGTSTALETFVSSYHCGATIVQYIAINRCKIQTYGSASMRSLRVLYNERRVPRR
jgi:hypothetical protein